MKSPRVLVAGAGYLGMALAERMKDSAVTLARRSAIETAGFKAYRCDFSDADTLRALPEFDLVYYAASADKGTDEAYEKAYFTGLKNLVDHFKTRAVRPAFFYSSSTSVYAADQGEICTETAPLTQSGPSRHMVRGEAYLLESGLRASVLRYGGIYGPGRTSFLQRVRVGLEALTPGHVRYMNRIHQADAVGLVPFLFEKEANGIFNAVDQEPTIRDEVILWVAEALGLPRETIPLSSTPPSRGHRRVVSTQIQDLGYRFQMPSFREGYLPLLATLD